MIILYGLLPRWWCCLANFHPRKGRSCLYRWTNPAMALCETSEIPAIINMIFNLIAFENLHLEINCALLNSERFAVIYLIAAWLDYMPEIITEVNIFKKKYSDWMFTIFVLSWSKFFVINIWHNTIIGWNIIFNILNTCSR